MQSIDDSNDGFLFADGSFDDETVEAYTGEVWKVLIVDDDPEIHSVTQLALSDLIVLGRRLEYLHAYTGAEACRIIKSNIDIILVLLDVVMESDDAGLNVVKYIREELKREEIRIVLRTGQPGYAPEESVIKDYDINDYKTKTELTRRKLVTTVYAAIRSYQQIEAVNQNRLGLEKIIGSTSELLEYYTVHDFADGVLKQLNKIINDSTLSLFCARGQGNVEGIDDLSFYVLGQQGMYPETVNSKLETLEHEQATENIHSCFQQKAHLINNDNITLYLSSGGYRAAIYIELDHSLTTLEYQLIEVFLTNVAIGYENVHLFQRLSNAAFKDWLTELPNRLEFVNLLDDFSQDSDKERIAALIDLDHFSDINDGLGQDVGNQLLNAVTQRLLSLGAECNIARIGADVFGLIGPKKIVVPDVLEALFLKPFIAGEQVLPVNAHFGFCRSKDAASRGVNVLNQINLALNSSKKQKENTYAYYAKEMEEQTQWRLQMIRQLKTDFADDRLALWYQPQLNLDTGEVIGAEALLRWQTAENEFISPEVFIPLAEYSGLIIAIGDWVIEQACLQIKALDERGYHNVSISVNVSIPQFRRASFVDSIIETTDKYHVDRARLELEITENILMDDPQMVIDSLKKLKEYNIHIALDDFGTGYSSLSYLQQLPLDRLKVDRSFVNDITDPEKSLIAETIINLGRQMGLKVIAEGIEHEDQQAHLIAQGCHEVQGFYYARPMPADQFFEFLTSKK